MYKIRGMTYQYCGVSVQKSSYLGNENSFLLVFALFFRYFSTCRWIEKRDKVEKVCREKNSKKACFMRSFGRSLL